MCDETRVRETAERELDFMRLMAAASGQYPRTLRTSGSYSVHFRNRTEDRDDMLTAAFLAGVAELEEMMGGEPDDWEWGRVHGAEFRNETLGESGVGFVESRFNRGPVPAAGGTDIVNATGWNIEAGYEVVWLPSFRMVVDLDDFRGVDHVPPFRFRHLSPGSR